MSEQSKHSPSGGAKASRLSSMVGASAPASAAAPTLTVDNAAIARAAVLAGLFVWMHAKILLWLGKSWMNNVNWGHGMLIPLFSLYLIYTRWGDIQRTDRKPFWPGLILMLVGLLIEAAVLTIPTLYNFSLYGGAMVVTLFGLVLYLGGLRLMRYLWLPVLYLVLAVPWPESIYVRVAMPLQEVAAKFSVLFLKACGVEIYRQASNMTLISQSGVEHQLTVAEACSGMHLLMAFFALGVAMAYLETRPIWQRVVLVLAAVPIAVFCNILRVIITCMAYFVDKEEFGQGVLHEFTGMLMLIPAFLLLWGLGWVLNRLFVEDDDEGEPDAEPAPAAEDRS